MTNNDIHDKYCELTSSAYGKLMVAPKRTMPNCNGIVLMRLLKKFLDGLKIYAYRIPKNIAKAALPIKREIKTSNANIKLGNVKHPL
tara:strand:+ start:625 stop:885 length:261 start_codon:yes stop_codon:yes gene_type:complete